MGENFPITNELIHPYTIMPLQSADFKSQMVSYTL